VKAVLFDLFETLVTQQYADRPAEQSFVDKLGLNLDDVRAWWKSHTSERMTGEFATYQETLSALCGSLGASIESATIEEISRDRLRRKREYLLGVDAKIVQVLSQLRSNDWTIGIVSNATPDEVASWPKCPLRNIVDDAVFSCQIGYVKPDPEIYHLACERLGVAPTKTVFVGDGGFDELQGAAAVGMRPVQARWYYARKIEWNATSELSGIDDIDDLFHRLEHIENRGVMLCTNN